MPPKKVVCNIILQALTFVFLGFCFIYFFMKDQMATFMKGRTTITRRVENVNSVEFPTIIICFKPATKLSIAKKYGFESHNDKFYTDVPNKTLPQIFDEISYGFDEDYSIWNYNGKKIHLGSNNIDAYYSSVKMQFQVETIKTYNSGTCIKLEPRFETVSTAYKLRLSIQLSSSIDIEDKIDSLLLIFTSNTSWINIPMNIWPQYKSLKTKVDLSEEYTHLNLQPEEEYFKDGTESSSDCLKELIKRQNCSYPCWTTTIPGIPFCQTVKDFNCVKDVWLGIKGKDFLNCYMTKKATYYSLMDRVENPYHKDKNALKTDVYIGIRSMKKVIKEEVFVLTLQDLIGSVGGSLGLFFGFSFSAVLFSCLNAFFQ